MEEEEIKLLIHVYSSLGLHRIVFCSNLSGESRRLCCVAKGHMQKRLPTLKVVQRGIFRTSWPTWHPWKLGNYNSLETISHGGESDALQATKSDRGSDLFVRSSMKICWQFQQNLSRYWRPRCHVSQVRVPGELAVPEIGTMRNAKCIAGHSKHALAQRSSAVAPALYSFIS